MSEAELDGLYQLPPGEFVAARNALAVRAGDRRADVRRLEKPTAAAWGVNQLFWRRRKLFDRLTAAFEGVRRAQAQRLAGQPADLARAEAAHRLALNRAVAEIRVLLNAAGDAGSPATMTAVSETLQALPFSNFRGRLSRPLAPVGFAALAGLLNDAAPPHPAANVVSITQGRRPTRPTSDARDREEQRAAERLRADIERAEAALSTAREDAHAADTLAARAADAASRAEESCARLRADLDAAELDLRQKRASAELAARTARDARDAVAEASTVLRRLAGR